MCGHLFFAGFGAIKFFADRKRLTPALKDGFGST
jgi:hypothetical protein